MKRVFICIVTAALLTGSTYYAPVTYPFGHAVVMGLNASKVFYFLKNRGYDAYISKSWNNQTAVFERKMTDRDQGAVLSNLLSKELSCTVIYFYSKRENQLSIYAYNKGAQLMRYEGCIDYDHDTCLPMIAGLDKLLEVLGKQNQIKEIKESLCYKETVDSVRIHKDFVKVMGLTSYSTPFGYDFFKTNYEQLKDKQMSEIIRVK